MSTQKGKRIFYAYLAYANTIEKGDEEARKNILNLIGDNCSDGNQKTFIILYNSCRNRHCPKCQGLVRAKWLNNRMKELLPVEYFHVVYTIPDILNRTVLCNKEVVYDILFRAVKEWLLTHTPESMKTKYGWIFVKVAASDY